MTDIPDNRGGLANDATPKALEHQADNLREAITHVLNDCVNMCADSITCLDQDKYIRCGLWEGEGPNNYYRDRILALFQAKEQQGKVEVAKKLISMIWDTDGSFYYRDDVPHEVLAYLTELEKGQA